MGRDTGSGSVYMAEKYFSDMMRRHYANTVILKGRLS